MPLTGMSWACEPCWEDRSEDMAKNAVLAVEDIAQKQATKQVFKHVAAGVEVFETKQVSFELLREPSKEYRDLSAMQALITLFDKEKLKSKRKKKLTELVDILTFIDALDREERKGRKKNEK